MNTEEYDVAWEVLLEDPTEPTPISTLTVILAPSADDARFLANEQYKDDGLVAVQVRRHTGCQR